MRLITKHCVSVSHPQLDILQFKLSPKETLKEMLPLLIIAGGTRVTFRLRLLKSGQLALASQLQPGFKLQSVFDSMITYLVSNFENHHISGILTVLMQIHKEIFISFRIAVFALVSPPDGRLQALTDASLAS